MSLGKLQRAAGATPQQPGIGWLRRNAWNWEPAVLDNLLAAERKQEHRRVFLCGMAVNQDLFLDRFDLVLMLDIDLDTMLARLDKGSRGNDFVFALGVSDYGARNAVFMASSLPSPRTGGRVRPVGRQAHRPVLLADAIATVLADAKQSGQLPAGEACVPQVRVDIVGASA